MWMLTAYCDETGSYEDPNIRFVGMAGLLATSANWEWFESEWKIVLAAYALPYFHMKDFAHSRLAFEGWKGQEEKRRSLLSDLMACIRGAYALPFGTTIPMEPFRKYPLEAQTIIGNHPYQLAFIGCNVILADMMAPARTYGEKIATVFAEQTQFQNLALKAHATVQEWHPSGDLFHSPVFRPMRELVPLQAADLVAYEAYKEADRRRYRPHDAPRWGWTELIEISKLTVSGFEPFIFQNDALVAQHMQNAINAQRDAEIQVRAEMAYEYEQRKLTGK